MPLKMQWKTDPELIDLKNFLIEKCKDAQSPLNLRQLTEEFKEKSVSSQEVGCLEKRIQRFRSEIHQLDSIDTEAKVKMMFALGASIDEELLNKLRKDADVEVDGKNRITKYISKNGSLHLEGDQSHSAKIKEVLKQRKSRSENSQEDSGDGSQNSTPKTPGSVERAAVEVPNSSKRTKVKSEDSAPDDSAGIPSKKPSPPNPETQLLRQPKLEGDPGAEEASIFRSGGAPRASGLEFEGDHSGSAKMKEVWKQRKSGSGKSQEDSGDEPVKPSPKTPGSVKRSAVEVPNSSKRTRDSSPTPVMNFDDYAPNDSARAPEYNPRIQQHRQPKQEEVTPGPSEARQEAPILRAGSPGAHSPQATPIKPELDQDEDDVTYTPQIIFLEAIHFVVINLDLDMPSLSMLKAKIEKNLRESPNALIPNEEIILAMNFLVMKMTNHAVSNLPEHVKSVGLSDFLCYLKAAILNSKLKGLEDLLTKIQRRINNPSLKLKNIPVEKVASDLRTTINVIKL